MEFVAIDWHPCKRNLGQIYSTGLEYAMISKNNKQLCPFVYCKDFLQDIMLGYLHNRSSKIYGFSYNPDMSNPIDPTKTRILITKADDRKFCQKVKNFVDFINQIESEMQMKKTIVSKCLNPLYQYRKCGVWLLESSKRWMKSPPMISMYSLLIRIGCVHTIGEKYSDTLKGLLKMKIKALRVQDRVQLRCSYQGIKDIIRIGDRKIFYKNIYMNYPADLTVEEVHHIMGINGFSSGKTKIKFPYWHRLIK